MKAITITLLIALFAIYANCATLVNDARMITRINNHPKASWTAKAHNKFEGLTLEQAKKMLGTFMPVMETLRIPRYNPNNVPSADQAFDARTKWSTCIGSIRNQGQCGSCWAFSGAEVMGDRFCIASNGTINISLSPEYMLACDDTDYGCDGGILSNEWNFLSTVGTTSEECFPYSSGVTGDVPSCPTSCQDGSAIKLYKANPKSVKLFDGNNLEAIQNDIATYGPVQGGFNVYQDFFTYSSGVYRHLSGGLAGGHAIKIIGWGVDTKSKLPYWIVANSWGEDWGLNGFFWILRGSNECNIESQIYSARPQL